jgi:hypothetical protein
MIKVFAVAFTQSSVADEVTHVSQGISIPTLTSAPFSLSIKSKRIKNNEKRKENDFSFEIYSDLNPILAAAQGGRIKIKFPREFHINRKKIWIRVIFRFFLE